MTRIGRRRQLASDWNRLCFFWVDSVWGLKICFKSTQLKSIYVVNSAKNSSRLNLAKFESTPSRLKPGRFQTLQLASPARGRDRPTEEKGISSMASTLPKKGTSQSAWVTRDLTVKLLLCWTTSAYCDSFTGHSKFRPSLYRIPLQYEDQVGWKMTNWRLLIGWRFARKVASQQNKLGLVCSPQDLLMSFVILSYSRSRLIRHPRDRPSLTVYTAWRYNRWNSK